MKSTRKNYRKNCSIFKRKSLCLPFIHFRCGLQKLIKAYVTLLNKITRFRDQVNLRVETLYDMSPPYKFGGHKYFTSRDMFLVSQVNKEDHLINGSGGYYNTNPSR